MSALRSTSARTLRTVIAVFVIAVLLGGALLAAITALNRGVYSAGGFVGGYLDSLARHDTEGALALPGVVPSNDDLEAASLPQNLPRTLLRASVLGDLTDLEQISDTETSPGLHTVVYDFLLDGEAATMQFTVQSTGTFAGVFTAWRFATSPLAVLQVTVLHERAFTVNGLDLDTRAHAATDAPDTFSTQAAYLAFAPMRYSFAHDSTMLSSEPLSVPVVASGATDVTINAMPTETFTGQVQAELNSFLDKCIVDQVLQPSNCPFGITINDRVLSAPVWSIAQYPSVLLEAGESSFEMASTTGLAHIVVDVQSLFDGDKSTRDEDVSFVIGLSVTIQSDGNLAIQLR
ncbi:hypothetical protein E3T55_14750 [Cryobacterium frigoriphilum]|uniref:Uncharacterized protein n=1 Tax=Cryobacterium frigoriphilum TaxID=1259150 RepID=A0A4R8ZWG5_9MICO|nr:hypothetical protein [Cryobacterium frigoriphilum]TFD47810.1 hypothetical protein E3T55_14750 [Cryobacterium frigoriphilum]